LKMNGTNRRRRRELRLDRVRLLAEAERAWAEAREHFVAFRAFMRPQGVWNWWTQDVALELQRFYEDMVAGRRPKLALMAPPQHGKTTTAEDFIAWVAGRNPNWKTIYASYSEELGVTRNLTYSAYSCRRAISRCSETPASACRAGLATPNLSNTAGTPGRFGTPR
jgi:hypothetical protein